MQKYLDVAANHIVLLAGLALELMHQAVHGEGRPLARGLAVITAEIDQVELEFEPCICHLFLSQRMLAFQFAFLDLFGLSELGQAKEASWPQQ